MPLHDYDQQTRVELQEEITKLCGECAEFKFQLSEAKAEVARLRALLEPFAESAAYYDVFGIYGGVPVRHLRDARAALQRDTGEQP